MININMILNITDQNRVKPYLFNQEGQRLLPHQDHAVRPTGRDLPIADHSPD